LFLKTDGAGNLSFNSDLPTTSFTGATVETSIADSDLVLIYDDSATAVRKMTKANFASGIGGNMKPAFQAYASAGATLVNATRTKLQANTEDFDTDSCYDNVTNYRFTPNVSGKYFVYGSSQGASNLSEVGIFEISIFKNGVFSFYVLNDHRNNFGNGGKIIVSQIINMNGTTDYLELFVRINTSGTPTISGGSDSNVFGAYRLIGV